MFDDGTLTVRAYYCPAPACVAVRIVHPSARDESRAAYRMVREMLRRARWLFGVAEMLREQGDARGVAFVLDGAVLWLGMAERERSRARRLRATVAA